MSATSKNKQVLKINNLETFQGLLENLPKEEVSQVLGGIAPSLRRPNSGLEDSKFQISRFDSLTHEQSMDWSCYPCDDSNS